MELPDNCEARARRRCHRETPLGTAYPPSSQGPPKAKEGCWVLWKAQATAKLPGTYENMFPKGVAQDGCQEGRRHCGRKARSSVVTALVDK